MNVSLLVAWWPEETSFTRDAHTNHTNHTGFPLFARSESALGAPRHESRLDPPFGAPRRNHD